MRKAASSYQCRQKQALSILNHSPKTKTGPNMHSLTHTLSHTHVCNSGHSHPLWHYLFVLSKKTFFKSFIFIIFLLSQRHNPNTSGRALKALKYSAVLSLSTGARTVHDIEQRTSALERGLPRRSRVR